MTSHILDDEENNKFLSERLLGGEGDSATNDDDNDDHDGNEEYNNGQYNNLRPREETVIDNEPIAVDIGENNNNYNNPQQPVYRDAPFAIAFLIHISVVLSVAVAWGFSALRQQDDGNSNNGGEGNASNSNNNNSYVSLSGLLWLCFLTCFISIGISAASLQVMVHHAEILIQSSLIGSCCFMAVIAVLFFMEGRGLMIVGICWVILLLVTAWYAKSVWNRIPFAAANLRTALSAVQTNGGVCVVAYGIAFVAMIWTVIWSLALIGVSYKESTCGVNGVCQPHMNAISILLLLLSFYWTSQVLQNVLHVTVSGVVGTWWFDPQDALSVFSPAILDSFRRATTYSFGSICMGSLLVAIIQSMEAMVRSARRQNNQGVGTILLCIIECILRMISRIAIYFNRWAYCYVGLYGFDYISSGKKAMELFQARGWTTIITDNLVQRSLALVSIVIGALSGIICMLVAKATGWTTTILGSIGKTDSGGDSSSLLSVSDDGIVFLISFLIGVTMAFILLSVVLSAVDTVIVAFAEAPAEFNTNHPALYNNMIQKWRLVFPEECVDFN